MKKDKKKSILDSRQATMVVSLVLAVFAWMLITMYIDRASYRILTGVPVNFSYDSTRYTSQGLDIVNQPEATVSVRLDGSGTTIGEINSGDLVVYPDYSSVKNAGSQVLNLNVRITDSTFSSGVTATLVSNVRTVNVVFDTIVQRTIPVTVEANDLKLAEGYVLNRTSCVPGEVVLSGPESEINSVARAVARVSVDQTLSDSLIVPMPLVLEDADGNELNLLYTEMDNDSVDVTISVYLQRELPLAVNFINAPAGFDMKTLKYSLSQESLTVAGPARQLEALNEISVASFDLSTFVMNQSYQLAVELPSGLVSQEGIGNVTLSIDNSGLETKTLNVTNLRTVNVPAGIKVNVETSRIMNVTLVGPKESLDAIASANVEAQIDGNDISVSDGKQKVAVRISVPSRNDVFVIGNYTAQCSVTASGG